MQKFTKKTKILKRHRIPHRTRKNRPVRTISGECKLSRPHRQNYETRISKKKTKIDHINSSETAFALFRSEPGRRTTDPLLGSSKAQIEILAVKIHDANTKRRLNERNNSF